MLVLPLHFLQLAVNCGAGAGLMLQRRGSCVSFVATLQGTKNLLPSGHTLMVLNCDASMCLFGKPLSSVHHPCRGADSAGLDWRRCLQLAAAHQLMQLPAQIQHTGSPAVWEHPGKDPQHRRRAG